MKEIKPVGNGIKIVCRYKEDGPNVAEIIKQSFNVFIKSELIKLCAFAGKS